MIASGRKGGAAPDIVFAGGLARRLAVAAVLGAFAFALALAAGGLA